MLELLSIRDKVEQVLVHVCKKNAWVRSRSAPMSGSSAMMPAPHRSPTGARPAGVPLYCGAGRDPRRNRYSGEKTNARFAEFVFRNHDCTTYLHRIDVSSRVGRRLGHSMPPVLSDFGRRQPSNSVFWSRAKTGHSNRTPGCRNRARPVVSTPYALVEFSL